MSPLELVLAAAVALFIIRRTDAIYWYTRTVLPRDTKYEAARKDDVHWLDYLNERHDNFWTELVACPFCLGFWFAGAAALTSGRVQQLPAYYLAILAIYLLLAATQAALRKL